MNIRLCKLPFDLVHNPFQEMWAQRSVVELGLVVLWHNDNKP